MLPVHVITPLVRVAHEPQPSRLLRSICEALVPVEGSQTVSQPAVDRVASFVAGQTQALPWFLRWPLRVGLAGFSTVVLITNLRPFTSLGIERRRDIVASWAWGRVSLARQLFRALRSTALLAWYEDAEATAEVQGE